MRLDHPFRRTIICENRNMYDITQTEEEKRKELFAKLEKKLQRIEQLTKKDGN